MAEAVLTNIGDFVAERDGEEIEFSTNEVTTTIVQGITATKSADKDIWVNGLLTYTVVVTNESGETLTDGVFSDQLNTTLVNLFVQDGNAVYIDGTPVAYTYVNGLVSVDLPDIADNESVTITFSVEQA